MLKNFIPERNISIYKSMVPYYGRHRCKQYIQSKSLKSGHKLWVKPTPLGYAIKFYPYAQKDANYDKEFGFRGSAMSLVFKLPQIPNSSYRAVMDNFFTSPNLLQLLKSKGIAASGTVRANWTKNLLLSSVD